jgi:hypothetical protein
MLQPTHWLHVTLVAIGHHFWPRLMAGAEIKQGRKTKKTAPSTQTPLQKEKTRAHHECMLSLPIWLHEISIFKNCVSPCCGLG